MSSDNTQRSEAEAPVPVVEHDADGGFLGRKNPYGEYELTRQQQAVVDHVCTSNDAVTAVDASAGTGKTFTLVRAILTLILNAWHAWQREDGKRLDIDQFVLITFTNKAADELEKKLYEALVNRHENAPTAEKQLWAQQLERLSGAFIGTIHSFCKGQILRPFGYDQGVAREAGATFSGQLLDDAIRDVMEAYAGGRLDAMIGNDVSDAQRIRAVLNAAPDDDLFDTERRLAQHEFHGRLKEAIELIHNRGRSTEDVLRWTCEKQNSSDSNYGYRTLFAALVRIADHVYRQKKAQEHVLDQYDMLDRAVRLLEDERDGVNVAGLLSERFRYLFIDEFQDTDQLQKRIVDAFVDHLDGILVVGDWKQSIYRFRGARPELLEELARDYMTENNGDPLPLTVSSRPSEPLRKAINTLFENAGGRFEGLGVQLEEWVTRWEPEDDIPEVIVRGAGFRDQDARIQAAADAIDDLLGQTWETNTGVRRSVELGDVVVLCRTNEDVETYARGLSERGIDARPDQGESLYQHPEIVATYRMLRLILNEDDAAALAAALPTPYMRDVDLKEHERDLVQYDIESDNFLIDKLRNRYPDILSASTDENEEGILNRLRRSVRTDTASQVLDQLYDAFGILEHYSEQGNTAAVQNLQRLREVARTLANDDQALTLRSFTSYVRQSIEMGRDETRVDPDDAGDEHEPLVPYVRVMTVHRAKGLEFPFVVIPEIQNDLIRDWAPNPPMILTERSGLDVSVFGEGREIPDTRSSDFNRVLHADRAGDVKEEMRVFYVAVTRAQHTVVLVGDGNATPVYARNDAFSRSGLGVDRYSWQDEVLRARSALETLANSDDNLVEVDFRFES